MRYFCPRGPRVSPQQQWSFVNLWGRFSMTLTSCPSITISLFGKTDNELANDMCSACWWWHRALKRLSIVFHNVFLCAWTWQIFGWKLVHVEDLGSVSVTWQEDVEARGKGEGACKLESWQRMIPTQLLLKEKVKAPKSRNERAAASWHCDFSSTNRTLWMRTSELTRLSVTTRWAELKSSPSGRKRLCIRIIRYRRF